MPAKARKREDPIFPHVLKPHPWMAMAKTPEGHPVIHLHYFADDDHDQAWADREAAKTSTQAWWDQEMEMKADAMSGQLVYPEFDESKHVIPHERIPQRGCRYMAIDPHPRTPHAFLWVLIDQWSDWYVYRELWPSVVYGKPEQITDATQESTFTIREYAETLAWMEGHSLEWRNAETDNEYAVYKHSPWAFCSTCGTPVANLNPRCSRHRAPERIIDRYMDQAGKGFLVSGYGQPEESMADRYNLYGIQCADPIKSHKTGEDAVRDLLKDRHHNLLGNWPRIHFSDRCPEIALELKKHRYKRTKVANDEKELKQEGVEARCHLIDLLRYLATARISYIPSLAS